MLALVGSDAPFDLFNARDFVGADAYGVSVVRPAEFLRQMGESR